MSAELSEVATSDESPTSPGDRRAPLRRYLHPAALFVIFVVAAALRFYDLNWDQSQYNHPDERHVTNVISTLQMPRSFGEYLDPARSPLNPYNNRQSWVYGTLPLFGGRALAEFLDQGCAPANAAIPAALGRLLFGAAAADCTQGFFTGYEHIRLVGRLLSMLADTITVLVVYLTGRRLFGWRVGLLAAAFSALAVLHIQHSKFFVVESALTMFVAWCLYFCARLATMEVNSRRDAYALWINAALAGLFAGLAVASKISAWPTAALTVVSIAVAMLRDRRATGPAVLTALTGVLIAGATAFTGFRLTQPYGFVGSSEIEWAYTTRACGVLTDPDEFQICQQTPSMPDTLARIVERIPAFLRPIIAPSARWIAELQFAAAQSSGTADPPWGWQWANRAAILFPLINIVFYGLGLPLGVAAVVGAFYLLGRLLRGRRWYAYLVPALWIFGFFLYQGTQFVKSLRYQLPIYPMLCIAAAVVLVAMWRSQGAGGRGQGPGSGSWKLTLPSPLSQFSILNSQFLIALVLAGTLAWALAFMRIYDGELTRTEASRWIYAHVPTALTLSGEVAGQAHTLVQLPIKDIALQPGQPFVTTVRFGKADGIGAVMQRPRFTLNYVEGEGTVQMRLFDAQTRAELGTARQRIAPGAATIAPDGISLTPETDYMIELTLLDGAGLRARTSVIANQHFDEGIPFRIEGKDGFGWYYRGLSSSPWGDMPVYNEDDPAKYEMFLNALDEADYIVLNSNRHYGSVARLPWRFPMTNAYYRALMGGELGFALVADFYRFPRIGPFVFNDQEMPQRLVRPEGVQGTPPGIEVPYPKAEEAFSVYDHPRVLIFKKTPAYSRALVERALSPYVDVRTVRQTAFQAGNTPGGLLLDQHILEAQRAGGTWRELFPRASPLNQSQLLAVLAWLALVEALGVAGFMLLAVVTKRPESTSRRPDEGRRTQDDPVSHTLRLASLVDGGYAFAKIFGLLVTSFIAWWLAGLRIAPFTPGAIWAVIIAFLTFAATIGHLNRDYIIALVRARWPALLVGEVLFVAAFVFFLLVRAGNPDLWHPFFGGEKPMDFAYLNSVLKATYFPPQDPWFAGGAINYYYYGFVMVGAPIKALGIDPAVAYNIVIPTLFALTACGAFGLGTSFYAARKGDDTPALRRAVVVGLVAATFAVVIGNGDQIRVVGPAWQKLGGIEQGVAAPVAFVSGLLKWLGGAPLPIAPWWPYWNPTRPAPEVMIAEFPNFTFLYADLHAHMMAMPLAYLALAFALAFATGARGWPAIIFGAIATGILWPTNSWDYPPYLLLAIAGLVLGRVEAGEGETLDLRRLLRAAGQALPTVVAFVALTRLAMAPYLVNYGSAYNEIDPWDGDRTRLETYITIYGLFLIPIGFYLLRGLFVGERAQRLAIGIVGGIGWAIGAWLALRGAPAAIIAAPVALLALASALLPGRSSPTRLLWMMTAGAFALTLFVELFTLRGDIGRMNTQFKFYIQAWLMLSVSAAVTLAWSAEALFTGEQAARRHLSRAAFSAAFAVAFFLAMLYPVFAIPAKVDDRYVRTAPRGLDGMAYMQYAIRSEAYADRQAEFPLKHDYDAIRWMQDNVEGSPTIIEEGAAGGNQYRWSARFSIYTGLPTVVGWEWHQRQQRAALGAPVVEDRVADVREFYSTTDIERARLLLRRYDVRYVIVGEMERLYNDPAGFDKFEAMVEAGDLRIAYQNPGVTIYAVTPRATMMAGSGPR
ncbi:MAG: hypothetical protein KatS3mg053_2825 [Candidatus Roseilinea sp.]|nr:MAG: hypothetical protein KatS3mg053_2825 [Candidatus Roseilinea sp.]